jgi:hypothetical protein
MPAAVSAARSAPSASAQVTIALSDAAAPSRARNAFARASAWSRTASASSDAANSSAASAPAHACQAGETSNRLASSARYSSGP